MVLYTRSSVEIRSSSAKQVDHTFSLGGNAERQRLSYRTCLALPCRKLLDGSPFACVVSALFLVIFWPSILPKKKKGTLYALSN